MLLWRQCLYNRYWDDLGARDEFKVRWIDRYSRRRPVIVNSETSVELTCLLNVRGLFSSDVEVSGLISKDATQKFIKINV